eukprot:CAMPEP_0114689900 /NCGR_PEP_ID=MMETSP0191-20121206/65075_1 /TAXON_ID=126664 /ORGANISM="Sorites sp." /LENGTH=106 /DNA_ID=CAMNT_0001979115 /DNA_START=65 /DNA_END=384 /DNA_ORIENTATION=-
MVESVCMSTTSTTSTSRVAGSSEKTTQKLEGAWEEEASASKSKDSKSSSGQPSPPDPEAHFQNPYVDPVNTEEIGEESKEESNATDEKMKGLLARVEALAQFAARD